MPPIFIINTADISKSLYVELEHLKQTNPRAFDKLVTEAIGTIFEGINERYFHVTGLPNKVNWRFAP